MLRRNQGFLCADCPKLFPLPQPPAPAPSPAPGDRKRAMRRLMNPATLFQMITKERHSEHRASTPRDGVKIRGRWSAPCTYSIFHTLSSLLKCNQPRPREEVVVLVLRSMGPVASTVKIFSTSHRLVSGHSSCSLTRIPIAQLTLRSHLRASTSTELWNKVSRGSRRKHNPPRRECILYFMYRFAQH